MKQSNIIPYIELKETYNQIGGQLTPLKKTASEFIQADAMYSIIDKYGLQTENALTFLILTDINENKKTAGTVHLCNTTFYWKLIYENSNQ